MSRHLDLRPYEQKVYEQKIRRCILWFLGILGGILITATLALAAEVPPEATLMLSQPLPGCKGTYNTYDTDGNPANGAEFHTLETEDGRVVLVAEFAPGDEGVFKGAVIQVPGLPEVHVEEVRELMTLDPCDLITAAGTRL